MDKDSFLKNDFPKIWPVSVSNYFTWIFVFLKESWNVLLAAHRVIKRDKYLLLIDASFNYLQIQVKDGQINFIIFLKKKIMTMKIRKYLYIFSKPMDK